jgi:hypothetical protein
MKSAKQDDIYLKYSDVLFIRLNELDIISRERSKQKFLKECEEKETRNFYLRLAKNMLKYQEDINLTSKISKLSIDEISQLSKAIKMLSCGDDKIHIAEMTGFSVEELEHLLNDDKDKA